MDRTESPTGVTRSDSFEPDQTEIVAATTLALLIHATGASSSAGIRPGPRETVGRGLEGGNFRALTRRELR